MTASPVNPDERQRIIAALEGGATQHATAQRFKRSKRTVNEIAKAAGVTDGKRFAATEKAAAARRDYALAERLELLSEALDKARSLITGIAKPAEMWQLSTALKTLIETRRLEEGEATSRTESQVTDVRQRLEDRLDELAARRAMKAAS